jgi:protocatechuate 3,4-dioxygenase beta subunit
VVSVHPPLAYPDYRSTGLRAPSRPPLAIPLTLTELTGPVYGHRPVTAEDADLTTQHDGEPLGQRIIVHGRLLDGAGRPVRGQLVEVWQANACGRYAHAADRTPLPLDPNFTGAGRTITDDDGRYRFVTVKPAPYPWGNHPNAWRPAHIHFSVFGPCFSSRLVTQMYFPDDPLFAHDPIFQSVPEAARPRLVSRLDLAASIPEHALAFRFDVVVRGAAATPMEA